MFPQLNRSIVFNLWGYLFWLGLPLATLNSFANAQILEQVSELLQRQNTPQQSSEELPIPQQIPQNQDASTLDNSASDSEAAQRIYLGLEAEEQPSVKGLRVATVTRDSPAWKAGFEIDDRIIGINGFSINKMSDMIEQLGKTTPGQSVVFLINRDKRTLELTAVLISQSMAQQIFNQPGDVKNDAAWIGLTVHDLTLAFREQFGIGAFRGAAVSRVVPGSPAHRSGIRAGDAITEVDARPIESAKDFVEWLETVKPGDQVTLIVYRGIARIPMQIVLASEPRAQQSRPAFQPIAPRPRSAKEVTSSDIPNQSDIGLPADRKQIQQAQAQAETQREIELQQEVERLKQELAEAQAKLNEARQQLNSILRTLRE